MAIAGRLGPDGRPIDPGLFGDYGGLGGFGGQLATLPGTPVLGAPGSRENPIGNLPGYLPTEGGGGSTTNTGGFGAGSYNPGGGANVSNDQTPAPGGIGSTTGGGGSPKGNLPPRNPYEGIEGNFQIPGDTVPFTPPSYNFGNPGAPPPTTTAGVTPPGGAGNFFGGADPFQTGITGSINGQNVPFDSRRYVTPEAANKLGQTFGANVVSQNTQGMASPGSGAPSAPQLGLDFGGGRDVQDASMGAFQLARGDRPEDVAARYAAGLTHTGWGGPAPATSQTDFWNTGTPASTYNPQQSSPDQAALIAWLRGQLGQ